MDDLTRAYAAIVDEARAEIAAGRKPSAAALEARLRAVGVRERSQGDATRTGAIGRAERRALEQLHRVLTVHRARALLAREPSPPPAPATAAPLRAALRARPTISGNMDVRREGDATLGWEAAAAVTGWEVRISERPDTRVDYVVRETLSLPATATAVELPLGERPLRVHLLGRGRDGRLLRRAVISALTRASWGERWERRASAS